LNDGERQPPKFPLFEKEGLGEIFRIANDFAA
jgi:hypothetical protein